MLDVGFIKLKWFLFVPESTAFSFLLFILFRRTERQLEPNTSLELSDGLVKKNIKENDMNWITDRN